ncbi:OLC1v1038335C1 [Oldenlandia corymbosa var. corymbosa]|uniref:OLC1v1038335C1 n=1 Tax=Oldenlandia corymbosa var. corymbosa TaxID=529605 RepID=A0AAV1CZH7_OLDCO|nr:OLC1v1038335C1 [Oldenlandia corymbosa var. corymbosa]
MGLYNAPMERYLPPPARLKKQKAFPENNKPSSSMEYLFSDNSSPKLLGEHNRANRSPSDTDSFAKGQHKQHIYRNFSWEKMQSYVRNNWGGYARVIHKVKNFFVFKFNSREILKMVMYNSPFAVDGGLLVLSRWFPNMSLEQLRIERIFMGIHLYGLPVECLTPPIASRMTSIIEEPLSVGVTEIYARKATFLRAKCEIKPYDPLPSGFFLHSWNGESIWIKCSYDRLYKYCQYCGVIGHVIENCSIDQNEELEQYLNATFDLNGREKNVAYGKDDGINLFSPYMRMTDGQINKKSTRLSQDYINRHFYIFQEVIRLQRRCAVRQVGHDLREDPMQVDTPEPEKMQPGWKNGFDRNNGPLTERPSRQLSRPRETQNSTPTNIITNRSIRDRAYMSERRVWIDPQDKQPVQHVDQGEYRSIMLGEMIFSQNRASLLYSSPSPKIAPFNLRLAEEIMDQLITCEGQRGLNVTSGLEARKYCSTWSKWIESRLGPKIFDKCGLVDSRKELIVSRCYDNLQEMSFISEEKVEMMEQIRLGKRPVQEGEGVDQKQMKKRRYEKRMWDEAGCRPVAPVRIRKPSPRSSERRWGGSPSKGATGRCKFLLDGWAKERDLKKRARTMIEIESSWDSNSSVNDAPKCQKCALKESDRGRGYGKDVNWLIERLGKAMEERN